MKISMARMITDLVAKGRALGNRFAWWSRWFPPARTVEADRFQGEGEPYPDHWREFPHPWPDGATVTPQVDAALTALPDLWRRVVILRDVRRPVAHGGVGGDRAHRRSAAGRIEPGAGVDS